MARRVLFAALFALPFFARAESPSHLSGYVTAVQSADAFDLEGVHIRLTPSTEFRSRSGSSSAAQIASWPPAFYVGETLDARGAMDHRTHSLTATQIVLVAPSEASVNGTAIIDLVPASPPGQPATERTVRADGFLLKITAKTKLDFAAPLTSISDINTNQWIAYSGVQQLDGTVLLDRAGIRPNIVNRPEEKLRGKNEYDPAAVTDANRQGAASKFFAGTDSRRIPPYHDADMQARVERIGESLVPAYQRALPDSDPTKIHFRFQVIDTTKWRDAVTAPSGIIVVPRQVVERMQNDSQLAAVLADNIAEAIEKDGFRMAPVQHRILAANLASTAAGFVVPGVGLVTQLTTADIAERLVWAQLQQSGRVSLDFLHDAGYDIAQAPQAWWLLAPKSDKPLEDVTMPPRAANLYMVLGTTWHSVPEPAQSR